MSLAGLSKLANGETDVRHARRDFAPDELARLLGAAHESTTTFLGLTGPDRHFLYLAACAKGFRVSELGSMTPESFNRPDVWRVVPDSVEGRLPAGQCFRWPRKEAWSTSGSRGTCEIPSKAIGCQIS